MGRQWPSYWESGATLKRNPWLGPTLAEESVQSIWETPSSQHKELWVGCSHGYPSSKAMQRYVSVGLGWVGPPSHLAFPVVLFWRFCGMGQSWNQLIPRLEHPNGGSDSVGMWRVVWLVIDPGSKSLPLQLGFDTMFLSSLHRVTGTDLWAAQPAAGHTKKRKWQRFQRRGEWHPANPQHVFEANGCSMARRMLHRMSWMSAGLEMIWNFTASFLVSAFLQRGAQEKGYLGFQQAKLCWRSTGKDQMAPQTQMDIVNNVPSVCCGGAGWDVLFSGAPKITRSWMILKMGISVGSQDQWVGEACRIHKRPIHR